MYSQPAIYIVTPCRNAAKTIQETIQSVITQPAVGKVYYHVQDGASSDGTQAILAAIEERIRGERERYKHITFSWSSEKDAGMYQAIERGFASFSIPQECYMGWINADDILCHNTIQAVQVIAAALPEVEWLGGQSLVIDETSAVISAGRAASLYPKYFLAQGFCDGFHWNLVQQEGVFWRKRVWDLAGGINQELRLAGDWDLWRRMAMHADFVQLPYPTGAFRRHKGQLTENMSAYFQEMENILPQKKRQMLLREVTGNLEQCTSCQIIYKNNKPRCISRPAPFSLQDKVWLWGASKGLYSGIQVCRRIVSFLK